MNPNAKEFVPAHLQKKRQEEAEQVDGLARHLDRTDLNGKTRENGETSTTTNNDNNQKLGGEQTSQQQVREKQGAQPRSPANSTTATSTSTIENKTENSSSTNQNAASNNNNINNITDGSNRTRINNEQNVDNNDCNGDAKENGPGHEEDDRYLLRAGENICEFNGEQFIIPGDEYENDEEEFARYSTKPGYDFGNAEDNEDEDVCSAFDQFLENLPE